MTTPAKAAVTPTKDQVWHYDEGFEYARSHQIKPGEPLPDASFFAPDNARWWLRGAADAQAGRAKRYHSSGNGPLLFVVGVSVLLVGAAVLTERRRPRGGAI